MQSLDIYRQGQERQKVAGLQDYRQGRQQEMDRRGDEAYQRSEEARPGLQAMAERDRNVATTKELQDLGNSQLQSWDTGADTFEQDKQDKTADFGREMMRVGFSKEETRSHLKTMLSLTPEQVKAAQRKAGLGTSKSGSEKSFAPVTLVNKETGEKKIAFPTFNSSTGTGALKPGDMPEGFSISTETPEEKRAADALITRKKEGEKVSGKGIAKRQQDYIDRGIEAADGYANLVRAKGLLDAVSTGGIDAVSVRARQIFGVEGADEAELSNRLSKAVLTQLKATFGAAFTADEGNKLERIEAGLGKSTEGNKRLINQTMKIVERSAKRGIRAAEKSGDPDAAQEIRDSLAFTLDAEEPSLPEGVTEDDVTETMRINKMTREQVMSKLSAK